jgi:EAL domain-containing protein (putative c-di-GMP-specific phosphodiesterase class I)
MVYLKSELLRILEGKLVTPVFQPIISVNQKQIVGYEALVRGPSDSPLHSPSNLFDMAARYDVQANLEFVCREMAIRRFAHLGLPGKLFFNVSPSILLESGFKSGETLRFIKSSGLDPHVIIIELTEHQPTEDYRIMREAVEHYRSMGFEIALDDLGAGYSGLRLWAELKPEYVKIDKHFIQGLNEDRVKLNFVRSIQNMAVTMQCKVIAEGIESAEEFQAINKIGIAHAQGFYFARPMAQPPRELDRKLFTGIRNAENSLKRYHAKSVAEIGQIIGPVTADTPISYVLSLFQHDAGLAILPVVEDGIIAGLIYRDKFLSRLFSSRYGIELHGKHPIKSFIDGTPFRAEKNTAIEQVSEDRYGGSHFFPLVSLSAGLVDAQATRLCQSHVDISDLACEAKKQAKKRPGNNYFINRRKPNINRYIDLDGDELLGKQNIAVDIFQGDRHQAAAAVDIDLAE